MEKEKQLPQFPFKEISEKIEAKRDIYISLIRSTFNFSSVNDEEKTQIASDKFTAEKELYIERLKSYYIDALEEHKNKGTAMPTLSVFQGVNIFMEVLQSGLSFSENSNHIYLDIMIGSRGEVSWDVTSDAVVYKAQRVGAISHISDVVIVWKGEDFEVFNENGEFKVKHSLKFDMNDFGYLRDFLCGYVYVIYPSGYRELRMVNRQQMDDAYKMSRNKSNYNKISTLKSKVVKRALRFDRNTTIEIMVKTMEGVKIHTPKDDNFKIDVPEIAREVDGMVKEKSDIPYLLQIGRKFDEKIINGEDPQKAFENAVEEVQQQQEEEKKTDLFDGLDLNFD